MKKRILAMLLCVFLLAGCGSTQTDNGTTEADLDLFNTASGFPYTFEDATGTSVTVEEKPQTVAVLLSSLAQVWTIAGGTVSITVGETVERGIVEDSVILVDDGAGKTINMEILLEAEPDLVIYSTELAGQVECAETLRSVGIPAAGFRVDTFDEYLDMLMICTNLTERTERYDLYGAVYRLKVNTYLDLADREKEKPTVLFVRAGSSAKYTKAKTAENNFVCIMLQELGAINVADAAPILLDGLSTEEILLADPDIIMFTTMGEEEAGVAYMQSVLEDPALSTLTAVQEGRIYQLPKDLFQYKPNSRWADAYEYLFDLLYGEAS